MKVYDNMHYQLRLSLVVIVCLSILMAVFPSERRLAGLLKLRIDGSGGDNWSYKTCKAPFKSFTANTQLFTSLMRFLSPNQQRQNTKGKHSLSVSPFQRPFSR